MACKSMRRQVGALEREVGYLNTRTDLPESGERLIERSLKAAKLHRVLKAPARASEILETARAAGPLDRRVFDLLDSIYQEIEEPELVKRFGDEYIEYRRRTPMFIPGLARHRN